MKAKKPRINLIVIGHVDSGKSTTTGHLFYLCGKFDKRAFAQLAEEAEKNGKQSFKFAYVFDQLKSERQRGITIDICMKQFETQKYDFNIIDSPGHKDFIKNMISGATQSDAALLILDSRKGKYETGISRDGQTREHALLCYMFGIRQLIVAVNKMDDPSVEYDRSRFEEIQSDMLRQLKKIGYRKKQIQFVPVSGWTGENIKDRSPNLRWWKGRTLLESLDKLKPPKRQIDKPLRIPVTGVMKIRGVGTVVTGKVVCGVLKKGDKLCIGPDRGGGGHANKKRTVVECRSIEVHRKEIEEAEPGCNIGINLRIPANQVKKGDVLGEAYPVPPRTVKKFLAYVMIMDHPGQIKNGFTPVMTCHSTRVAVRFDKLVKKIDKKTQRVKEEFPRFIKKGESCEVIMVPQRPISIEKFQDIPHLGRFVIRDMNKTIGIGIVKEILEEVKER